MDLRLFASLRDRDLRREGILIGEGRLVCERVAARCRLIGFLADETAAVEAEVLAAGRCPVAILPRTDMEKLVGFPFHRGLLAAAERPPLLDISNSYSNITLLPNPLPASSKEMSAAAIFRRLIILPAAADPENLGAIARSAAALDWSALALGKGSCDPYGRRALRCSMGAVLGLSLFAINGPADLTVLRDRGWTVVGAETAADAREPETLRDIGALALVLGNERHGLSPDWLDACSFLVAIPQTLDGAAAVASLNVAAAAAILLWEGRTGKLVVK